MDDLIYELENSIYNLAMHLFENLFSRFPNESL